METLEITDRIKTVADVLTDNNISQEIFDTQCIGLEPDEVAYKILKLLAKSLNQGWQPDWDNDDEWKYYPWFDMTGSSGFQVYAYDFWYSLSTVGSRLCYKTRALAEYAATQFVSVYRQFMITK